MLLLLLLNEVHVLCEGVCNQLQMVCIALLRKLKLSKERCVSMC